MQATMSTVVSYGVTDNGAGEGPTMNGSAAAYNPVMPAQLESPISSYPTGDGSAAGDIPVVVGEKKKRGRPRKYPVDGALFPLQESCFTLEGGAEKAARAVATPKPNGKRMGRPPGSKNKLKIASVDSPEAAFIPHIITVQAGEDVSSKIMAFPQNGSRVLCILSGNGAISNVTLRQASSSGGTITYEGQFEILSLSGSYILLEAGGQRSKTGGLSVLLVGPDGRILGGGVAGLLIAAAPVQVVVGCFNVGEELQLRNQVDYSAGPPKHIFGSPTSHETPSQSSDSPINLSNYSNPNSAGMMQWE